MSNISYKTKTKFLEQLIVFQKNLDEIAKWDNDFSMTGNLEVIEAIIEDLYRLEGLEK